MTQEEYLATLKALGLGPASQDTARALGLSLRQAQRLAAGECEVPGPAAILLRIYVKRPRAFAEVMRATEEAS